MLRGIDPLLSPDLLQALRAMGHGDHLVLADANFPAHSTGRKVIRCDGVDGPRLLQAILSVMPLDTYTALPALCMQVVDNPAEIPAVVVEYQETILAVADQPCTIAAVERYEFYDLAKAAFVVIQTGELRLYGNLILHKGVLTPQPESP